MQGLYYFLWVRDNCIAVHSFKKYSQIDIIDDQNGYAIQGVKN